MKVMAQATLRRAWLLPLVFFQLYLFATVVAFFLGPWPWDVSEPLLLATYLLASQAAIAIGYLGAWRRVLRVQGATSQESHDVNVRHGVAFLKRSLLVSFALLIPTCLSRTGSFFPDVWAGIVDTGAVYNLNQERLEAGNPYVLVEYLRMLLSPMLLAVMPLTLVYWSQLSKTLKVAGLTAIALNVALFIATGTNKGIADLAITLPWLVYLGVTTKTLKLSISPRALGIGFAGLFLIFLIFFGAGQTQREGGVGELGVFNTGFSIIDANRESGPSTLMPDGLRVIYESLTRYVGQGYYALSMTFDIDHSSTFGVGNSMFLARNADAIVGTDQFTAGSLPGLLEAQTGWPMSGLWHSIYPWLASDFGFVGALVVIGVLAYLFGLSWGYAITTAKQQWITLGYLLLILFYYVPGNNQIFQTGESCAAFLLIVTGLFFTPACPTRKSRTLSQV